MHVYGRNATLFFIFLSTMFSQVFHRLFNSNQSFVKLECSTRQVFLNGRFQLINSAKVFLLSFDKIGCASAKKGSKLSFLLSACTIFAADNQKNLYLIEYQIRMKELRIY
ncbi:MAG: hypothetical protein ACI36X_06935, partial [Bacteroidaceae bacterium]